MNLLRVNDRRGCNAHVVIQWICQLNGNNGRRPLGPMSNIHTKQNSSKPDNIKSM